MLVNGIITVFIWQRTADLRLTSASADGRKPAETIGLCATLSSDTASGKEVRKEAKPDKVGALEEGQRRRKQTRQTSKPSGMDAKHTVGEGAKRRDHTNLISKAGTYAQRGGGKLLVTLTFTWLPPLIPPSPLLSSADLIKSRWKGASTR